VAAVLPGETTVLSALERAAQQAEESARSMQVTSIPA
jgi:hypothetical protein